jgi:hypothetical protein
MDDDDDMVNNEQLKNMIRKQVIISKIPVHIIYSGTDYFKMVSRFSYMDTLATLILKNNSCGFNFFYNNKKLNEKYPIGVLYDLSDPDMLPWKLVLLKNETDLRPDFSMIHLNALKHAEYLETGNIARLTNMSKIQHMQLMRDVSLEKYTNPFILSPPDPLRKVAIRIHFSDGQSLVICNKQNAFIYGIIQGILVEKTQLKHLIMLKNVDNWLHICFPNTITSSNISVNIDEQNNNKDIIVTFRSVGSTPIIKNNIIRFNDSTTISNCKEYVSSCLGCNYIIGTMFLYMDGMFSVEDDEPLYNLTLRRKDNLILYYSLCDAWN